MKNLISCGCIVALAINAPAQNIDFDFPGRQTSEVTEPDYIAWPVPRAESDTLELDNGTRIIVSGGEAASAIGSTWNKQTVQSGLRLVGDGIIACNLVDGNIVKLSSEPTAIVLTIEGMEAGQHSVIGYHNNTDKNQTLPPVQVLVDGVVAQTDVTYSTNSNDLKMSDVGRSYVEFTVTDGKPVQIKYMTVPEADVAYSTTSIMLNAIEFDVNPYDIMDELPANHDYHFDADDGSVRFQWKAADIAASHKLVYGTDSASVAQSETFHYEGSEAAFTADGFSPLVRYWWRVDEVEADGTVHKGKVRTFQPRRDAFPGAEGYGRYAIGGRGGVVYHVTSLADDGMPGTLRYGLTQLSGPRTIVFDVAGVIALNSRLVIADKFVTIAGQTAPGRGIMLRNKPFGMQSDGITRFIRLRLGGADDWDGVSPNENTADGMGMTGNDNSIMDHCSIAWTLDEGFSSRNAKSMTLQKTIISEALNYAGHATQYDRQGHHVEHGYAATIGGGGMGSLVGSYHHNLLAHCHGRNWSISGGLDGGGNYDGHHDIFNNVCYNWGSRASDGGTHELNFVNNYYKKGAATTQNFILSHDFEGVGKGTQRAYVSGNIREELDGTKTQDALDMTYRYTLSNNQVLDWEPWSDAPFFESWANVESAEAAYKNVLSDVGCNQPELDNHDVRMVNETVNGTYTVVGYYTKKKGLPDRESDCEGFDGLNIIEAQRPAGWDTDQDGIPDWFEQLTGTDPASANNNDDRDGDHYTDLEEYLNWMASPNFTVVANEPLSIGLKSYFAGYGTISATADGATVEGEQLVFKASANGLYKVPVTVTEGGISLTRTFHFAVTDNAASGIRELNAIGHETTAADAPAYDLLGRRITAPANGQIYFNGGRKQLPRN